MKRIISKEMFVSGLMVGVVLVYLVGLEVMNPNFFLRSDNANYFLPTYLHNFRVVTEFGQIPQINYFQYLGVRHLAQGQSGVFYLPVYLAFWFSGVVFGEVMRGVQVLVVGHLLVSALGMYWLLRRKKVEMILSLLASLVWISFPFLVGVSRSWVVVAYLVAYLPWSFWWLEVWLESKGRIGFWGLVGMKLALLYAGYVQWLVMVGLFEVVYLAWMKGKKKKELKKIMAEYVKLNLWVLVLGAPQLLPMMVEKSESWKRSGAMSFGRFVEHYVDVGVWMRAQIFGFVENTPHKAESNIFYFGLVNVVVLVGLWVKKFTVSRKVKGWLVMAGLGLGLSSYLGGVLYFVPVLNWFRWPFKW